MAYLGYMTSVCSMPIIATVVQKFQCMPHSLACSWQSKSEMTKNRRDPTISGKAIFLMLSSMSCKNLRTVVVQFQGRALLPVMPAFSVIKATPVSIREMPTSSVLHRLRQKIGGKSTARIAITTAIIVSAFRWTKIHTNSVFFGFLAASAFYSANFYRPSYVQHKHSKVAISTGLNE